MSLRRWFLYPSPADLHHFFPYPRLADDRQSQPLPSTPPAVADDVIDRRERVLPVVEMTVTHPGAVAVAVAISATGDELPVELGVAPPLGCPDPGPAAPRAERRRRSAQRPVHRSTLAVPLIAARFQRLLSNRACGFPTHSSPMIFQAQHARRPPFRQWVGHGASLPCLDDASTVSALVAWQMPMAVVGLLALCHWGCWFSRPCPRAYLRPRRNQSRAPSLRRLLTAFPGTMSPLDSLPAPCDFGLPLIRAVFRLTRRTG